MPEKRNPHPNEIKKLLAIYNTVPNLIWSILNLVPISIYCFNQMDLKTLCIFLAVSSLLIFLRNSFLDKMQIGKTHGVYKKLGVHVINKVTQNGVIVNRLMKQRFPDYKVVTPKKASIVKLIKQTYLFEKFHLLLFVFFTLALIHAMQHDQLLWASLILLTNIVYNIYPNLLQQYIRVKLKLHSRNAVH